jgi:hypothetical protein
LPSGLRDLREVAARHHHPDAQQGQCHAQPARGRQPVAQQCGGDQQRDHRVQGNDQRGAAGRQHRQRREKQQVVGKDAGRAQRHGAQQLAPRDACDGAQAFGEMQGRQQRQRGEYKADKTRRGRRQMGRDDAPGDEGAAPEHRHAGQAQVEAPELAA